MVLTLKFLLILVALVSSCVSCWKADATEDLWSKVERDAESPYCSNREVRRSTSPSGAIDLVIFLRGCGVGGEHGYLSLVPRGEPINGGYGNLGGFYQKRNDPSDILVSWDEGGSLLLTVRSLYATGLFDKPTQSHSALMTTRDLAGESVFVQLEEDPSLPRLLCSIREMSRMRSPDGSFDFVVFEWTCGSVVTGGLAVVYRGQEPGYIGSVTTFDLRENPFESIAAHWVSAAKVVVELPNPPLANSGALGVDVDLVRPDAL